ncbi:MAG: hypothetical protein KF862_20955 [Chitinophagaceae bacterium]|nr:hypothetical protein [Chitinophagaceae bacterium]
MKNRFIIGLVAAIVTFSTLMIALGPKRFMSHNHHRGHESSRCETRQLPAEENRAGNH